MRKTGSILVNILREQERKMRLRFWRMLTRLSAHDDVECPAREAPPENSVHFGAMPRYLRGAYVQARRLRGEARTGEAEIYEEAINDLVQEHFWRKLRERRKHNETPIREFRLSQDWNIYAVPVGRE